MELEKLNLQKQCLYLEGVVHEKKEEYQKQNAVRFVNTEELKGLTKCWTDRWQNVALTLQTIREEIEELKKDNSRNEVRHFITLK